jgi:cell division protein FtsB
MQTKRLTLSLALASSACLTSGVSERLDALEAENEKLKADIATLREAGYVTDTDLAEYATQDEAITDSDLSARLDGYATDTDLGRYATVDDVVTDTDLANTLSDYATDAEVDAAGFVTDTDLTTTLDAYVTEQALEDADYVSTTDLTTYATVSAVDAAVATALADYTATAQLATWLGDNGFATTTYVDVGDDALDADADSLDARVTQNETDLGNAVRVQDTDLELAVPGEYASIAEALEALDGVRITDDAWATVRIADGVYPVVDAITVAHPNGNRIRIVGGDGGVHDPTVTLLFSGTHGIRVGSGNALGLLDGVVLDGGLDTGESFGIGLYVEDGAFVQLGAHVTLRDWPGNALSARRNATVTSYNCNVPFSLNNGTGGVASGAGSVVFAPFCSSDDNDGWGFFANEGGIIIAPEGSADGNGALGYGAQFGGIINARLASANDTVRADYEIVPTHTSNAGYGFIASDGGIINAHDIRTSSVAGQAVVARRGGYIWADDASITSPTNEAVLAEGNGTVYAPDSTINSAGDHGASAMTNGFVSIASSAMNDPNGLGARAADGGVCVVAGWNGNGTTVSGNLNEINTDHGLVTTSP